MAFAGDEIFFADQHLNTEPTDGVSKNEVMVKFKHFLKEWTKNDEFVYKDQLIRNAGLGQFYIQVDLADIENFDLSLSEVLRKSPLAHINNLEKATMELLSSYDSSYLDDNVEFQVQINSKENPQSLRSLKSENIRRLINVNGIIINAGKTILKGKKVIAKCKGCEHEKIFLVDKGFHGVNLPFFCEGDTRNQGQKQKCPRDPYVIITDDCEYTDFQILKIQESPDNIPTGEIPRTYKVCCEKYLVDKMTPGSRVTVTGIYTIMERNTINNTSQTAKLKTPYIIAVGFASEQAGSSRISPNFSNAEIERFQNYSKDPKIYEKIAASVGSTIYGQDDIKKSIACLLFSGAAKLLPDNTRLRGDINILLLGDPSTAKSQFLKFVQKVAPISVYTSGKGSSAAGLTAAIIKDPNTSEFQLEGGALVLADGGVVCIDEFDKMKPADRVAIHEAMEQQTISVAKAGITTILNARASVLAAANPTFGRYDDFKKISDQIDLQTTILSRFDCIFIVRDIKSMEHDKRMAQHIVGLHTRENAEFGDQKAEFDLAELRNYILYAKMNVNPRMNEESAVALQNIYVEDRSKAQQAQTHIPVTVRQLEAIIRLSESIAKMRLSTVVTIPDVEEAHRIFNVSTMNAIKSGLNTGYKAGQDAETVRNIEESIKRMIAIGGKISYQRLMDDLEEKYADNLRGVEIAIMNLIKKEEFQQSDAGKYLARVK